MSNEFVAIGDEARDALAAGVGVAALEISMIAHAIDYPANLEAASELDAAVRASGAVPAFVAVVDGKLRVGLDPEQLDRLLSADRVAKVSQRDLGAVLASGELGATTVAVTMFAAAQFDIRMVVTGGIGGVHRGYVDSHDVSPDLTALGNTPVAVVCSGPKSLLDIGRTLEALETAGVPVLAFGTDRFPAYETSDSGLRAPRRVDDVESLAATLRAHWAVGMSTGAVVANPVPEEFAVDGAVVAAAIEAGLDAAHDQGVSGKDMTPFVLEAISNHTGGNSTRAALALTKSNAKLAGELAVRLAASGPV